MLFNSYVFIFVFLPVTLAGYFFFGSLKRSKLANVWLVLVSLFFYSYWNVRYLPLLLGSIAVNYLCAGLILRYRKQPGILSGKVFFLLGIFFNAALLCFYKYMDFLIENFNAAAHGHVELLHIVLPLGISFFTITQMVYLVDCYEGVAKDHDLLNYCLFVSFFPHLLAGPILYHKPMMKQFAKAELRRVDWENMSRGFSLFIIGLVKKVVLADSFVLYVKTGFGHAPELTLVNGWLVAVSYMLQLYFDFSGYSDMAVGLARMLNIKIPINFDSPYRARNLIAFWSHWHMSLTNTIMSYLYTPMVMACRNITFPKAMLATFAAMFIAGIWHGAGWTFVVFGTMHAVGLVINHIWRKYHLWMPGKAAHCITLVWVLAAMVFFRAANVDEACQVLAAMAGLHGVVLPLQFVPVFTVAYGDAVLAGWPVLSFCLAVVLLAWVPNSNELIKRMKPSGGAAAALAFLFVYAVLQLTRVTEFLYFQF